MPFSQRNIFYLRTSAHIVLQTILYIDPRDLRWMNSSAYHDQPDEQEEADAQEHAHDEATGDKVWARALSKLQHKIMPKLVAESVEGETLSSTNKKEKVDVHIEPDFQMAYFFRKVSGRHAVLLKEKQLKFPTANTTGNEATTSASIAMPPPALPASVLQRSQIDDVMPPSRLAARESNHLDNNINGQASRIANDEEEDVKPVLGKRGREEGTTSRAGALTPPIRIKQEDEENEVLLLDSHDGTETQDDLMNGQASEAIDVDSIPDDKKPRLHVKYSGFKIFGKCFIVVIEPTKRTKRLRPLLFQSVVPKEKHQLSATPVPRQARSTPRPSSSAARSTPSSSRQSNRRLSLTQDDDMEDADTDRGDSRKHRLSAGLFRGTPSDYTPTPTPEPIDRGARAAQEVEGRIQSDLTNDDEDDNPDKSVSVMLATQMLEGGIAGEGNDIDDE